MYTPATASSTRNRRAVVSLFLLLSGLTLGSRGCGSACFESSQQRCQVHTAVHHSLLAWLTLWIKTGSRQQHQNNVDPDGGWRKEGRMKASEGGSEARANESCRCSKIAVFFFTRRLSPSTRTACISSVLIKSKACSCWKSLRTACCVRLLRLHYSRSALRSVLEWRVCVCRVPRTWPLSDENHVLCIGSACTMPCACLPVTPKLQQHLLCKCEPLHGGACVCVCGVGRQWSAQHGAISLKSAEKPVKLPSFCREKEKSH